jgi:hypothetical protein
MPIQVLSHRLHVAPSMRSGRKQINNWEVLKCSRKCLERLVRMLCAANCHQPIQPILKAEKALARKTFKLHHKDVQGLQRYVKVWTTTVMCNRDLE